MDDILAMRDILINYQTFSDIFLFNHEYYWKQIDMYSLWGIDDFVIDSDKHINTFTHPNTIFAYMPFAAHENECTYRKTNHRLKVQN